MKTIIDSLECICRHLLDVAGNSRISCSRAASNVMTCFQKSCWKHPGSRWSFSVFFFLTCGLQDVRGCGTIWPAGIRLRSAKWSKSIVLSCSTSSWVRKSTVSDVTVFLQWQCVGLSPRWKPRGCWAYTTWPLGLFQLFYSLITDAECWTDCVAVFLLISKNKQFILAKKKKSELST